MKQAVTAALAVSASAQTILTENVTRWLADINYTVAGNFTMTPGLTVTGELGWHSHGSGDNKDVDIDVAFKYQGTSDINTDYRTILLWGLPIEDATGAQNIYEVGMFEYERGDQTAIETWDLRQAIC